MRNTDIKNFCLSWLNKAQALNSFVLSEAFDKFFTLYVAYNRLYVEVTFLQANNGQINLDNLNVFPDRRASIGYVVDFLGAKNIEALFINDNDGSYAIKELKRILDEGLFNIKLHPVTGIPMHELDYELLEKIESKSQNVRVRGITEFIYSVRCNMFHGEKELDRSQLQVLLPVNVLLEKLIRLLIKKLYG